MRLSESLGTLLESIQNSLLSSHASTHLAVMAAYSHLDSDSQRSDMAYLDRIEHRYGQLLSQIQASTPSKSSTKDLQIAVPLLFSAMARHGQAATAISIRKVTLDSLNSKISPTLYSQLLQTFDLSLVNVLYSTLSPLDRVSQQNAKEVLSCSQIHSKHVFETYAGVIDPETSSTLVQLAALLAIHNHRQPPSAAFIFYETLLTQHREMGYPVTAEMYMSILKTKSRTIKSAQDRIEACLALVKEMQDLGHDISGEMFGHLFRASRGSREFLYKIEGIMVDGGMRHCEATLGAMVPELVRCRQFEEAAKRFGEMRCLSSVPRRVGLYNEVLRACVVVSASSPRAAVWALEELRPSLYREIDWFRSRVANSAIVADVLGTGLNVEQELEHVTTVWPDETEADYSPTLDTYRNLLGCAEVLQDLNVAMNLLGEMKQRYGLEPSPYCWNRVIKIGLKTGQLGRVVELALDSNVKLDSHAWSWILQHVAHERVEGLDILWKLTSGESLDSTNSDTVDVRKAFEDYSGTLTARHVRREWFMVPKWIEHYEAYLYGLGKLGRTDEAQSLAKRLLCEEGVKCRVSGHVVAVLPQWTQRIQQVLQLTSE